MRAMDENKGNLVAAAASWQSARPYCCVCLRACVCVFVFCLFTESRVTTGRLESEWLTILVPSHRHLLRSRMAVIVYWDLPRAEEAAGVQLG
jgi:hypothetical protein